VPLKKGGEPYAKDQAVPVVRWQRRRSDEFLGFCLQKLKRSEGSLDRERQAPDRRGLSATFQLDGQEFYALNGDPLFSFKPAISFFPNCETQPEVDEPGEKLSAGGEKSRCGWLKDKYGSVVANHSLSFRQDAAGQRCRESKRS
jgi:3-demethylubiquinone-9 3-methyltransferase